jgi:hypothetical protein
MPNWCANTLKITPTTDKARALLPAIAERFAAETLPEWESAFQLIHPMPEALKGTTSPSDSPNWYDWCVSNWGTKWSESHVVVAESTPDQLRVCFDTAWSPPIGVYYKLVELGFDVTATYAEQGIGFVGYWHNGDDHEMSLADFNKPVGDDDEDYPEDFEVFEGVFAGTGIPADLYPAHLGG